MPYPHLNKYVLILAAAALAACSSQTSTPNTAPALGTAPSASPSPASTNPAPVSERTLRLTLQGSAELQNFSTQQNRPGICVDQIREIETRLTLPESLPASVQEQLKTKGFVLEQNHLVLNQSLATLQSFVDGVTVLIPDLPAGTYHLHSEIKSATGAILGRVDYTITTQTQAHQTDILFKPDTQKDELGCPVLTPEISGGTFISASGGLMLNIEATSTPPVGATPAPEAPAQTPSPESSPVINPPAPPTALRIVARSTTNLTVQWDFTESRPHGYAVLLNGAPAINNLIGNYYTFQNLEPNTRYDIGVQSVIEGTRSEIVKINAQTTVSGSVASGSFSGGGGSSSSTTETPQTVPSISLLSPASAPIGATVVISGNNFSSTALDNTVQFGSTAATVTLATPTSLTVTVPQGLSNGPLNVTVEVGGKLSSAQSFTVTDPVGEFQINSTSTGPQKNVDIASDSNGNFVVVWEDQERGDIFFQRYNSIGVAQGTETLVNQTTTGIQQTPAVAMNSDGDFVIAWHDVNTGSIRAQQFDDTGTLHQSGEKLVETKSFYNTVQNPDVAMTSNGDFVITWDGNGNPSTLNPFTPGDHEIYFQRYDSTGTALGTDVRANTTTSNPQNNPAVDMNSDGDFVITWYDTATSSIRAQQFDDTGTPHQSGEKLVEARSIYNSVQNPDVAMTSSGDFVITWDGNGNASDGNPFNTSDQEIYFQRYDSTGTALGTDVRANTITTGVQSNPAIAMNNTGDFVVSWRDPSTPNGRIVAQRYDNTGTAQGSEIEVKNESGSFIYNALEKPVVTIDGNGHFTLAWSHDYSNSDISNTDIYARRYTNTGEAQ